MGALIIIGILVVCIAIWVMSIYNGLISSRNQVENAWSKINVELQRRFDLIPNLVETVKGYMKHEEGVLTKVTELRASWSNASTIQEKAKLEKELSTALNSIKVVAEQYPDLKANTNFLSLQEELSNTENQISTSRASYNNIVTAYNTKLEIFPNNIISNMFKFEQAELFKVEDDNVKNNVKVSF